MKIRDVRSAYRPQLLGGNPRIDGFWNQILQNFLPDIAVVVLANQRHGSLARTESLQMHAPANFLRDLCGFLFNVLNGNRDLKLVLTAFYQCQFGSTSE